MSLVYLVMGLALVQFMYFGFLVGGARSKYGIKAPAISGNDIFERHFRVQMNTLEQLIVLIPALPMFAYYIDPRWAAGLGILYLVGRFVYAASYVKDPAKRSVGFGLSFLPVVFLLIGGIFGAIRASLAG